jgi:hypothetical protein
MATYPSLAMHPSSRRILRDGRDEEIATSGKLYLRNLYTSDRYDFEIVHEALNSTDVATLVSFYGTNKNLAVDLVWPEDGATYTGLRFGSKGFRTEPNANSPTRRNVSVRLVGAA